MGERPPRMIKEPPRFEFLAALNESPRLLSVLVIALGTFADLRSD